MFVDPVRQFFSSVNDAAANDESASIPPNVRKGLADLGAYGLQVPEELSGLGLTNVGFARLVEEVGGADLGLYFHLSAHQSSGFKGILLTGTPEQKAKYLPALARGESLAALALTEPSLRAVLDADGKTWRVTGGKLWISNGGVADVFTVLAQTAVPDAERPGALTDRLTAFIVERKLGGVSHGPPARTMGARCANVAEVFFDATPVPAGNVLGAAGGGSEVAAEVLGHARIGTGAALAGAIKRLLARAAAHCESGAARAQLAGIAARAFAAESLTYALAANADRGMAVCALEAAALRVFASEAAWWAADAAVQALGGRGCARALPFERALRDARVFRVVEGSNDSLRLMIAEQGLAGARAAVKDGGALRAAARAARARLFASAPAVTRLDWAPPALRDAAADIEAAAAAFGDAAAGCVAVHQQDIAAQHQLLARVADVAIDITVTAATLARATESINAETPEAAAEADLANLVAAEAIARISDAMAHIKAHSDVAYGSTVHSPRPNWRRIEDLREKVARAVCSKGGYTAGMPLGI